MTNVGSRRLRDADRRRFEAQQELENARELQADLATSRQVKLHSKRRTKTYLLFLQARARSQVSRGCRTTVGSGETEKDS